MNTHGNATNPVVRTTHLVAASRWVAREHADGTFYAATIVGPAVSQALGSFQECVDWACDEERGVDPLARR